MSRKEFDFKIIGKSRLEHYCDKCGALIPIGSSYVRGTKEFNQGYAIRCYHRECFYPSKNKGVVKVEDKRITELRKEIEREKVKRKFYSEKIQELQECVQLSNKRINLSELQIFEIEYDFKEALRSEISDKLVQVNNLQYDIKKLKEKLDENN